MSISFSLARQANGQVVSSFAGSNMRISNIGNVSGTAQFSLSETDEGSKSTVFDVMQMNSNSAMSIDAAANDSNIKFSGYNIDAAFNSETGLGYNVELNTVNSRYDFSGNSSGAQVETSVNSAHNMVQLGGGKNVVHSETVNAKLTHEGLTDETRSFNNLVKDAGYSNVFLSSVDSITKFRTTEDSYGAFFAGGNVGDVVNIGGSYGVFQGGNGNNIFTTSEFKNMYDSSAFNVVFGGLGVNTYNDYGMGNMYQGAYALYPGYNGIDTIRMNGCYGIARVSAENVADNPEFEINGSFNAAFTGEQAEIDGITYNYNDILRGRVGQYSNDVAWTLSNFYSSNFSPSGYAALYGSQLLGLVMDEV